MANQNPSKMTKTVKILIGTVKKPKPLSQYGRGLFVSL